MEDFLTRGCTNTENYQDSSRTLVMYDLLWKYYEKIKNYAAAAKILAKLAERHRYIVNFYTFNRILFTLRVLSFNSVAPVITFKRVVNDISIYISILVLTST